MPAVSHSRSKYIFYFAGLPFVIGSVHYFLNVTLSRLENIKDMASIKLEMTTRFATTSSKFFEINSSRCDGGTTPGIE